MELRYGAHCDAANSNRCTSVSIYRYDACSPTFVSRLSSLLRRVLRGLGTKSDKLPRSRSPCGPLPGPRIAPPLAEAPTIKKMGASDRGHLSLSARLRRAVELDRHVLLRNASCQHSGPAATFCPSGRLSSCTSTTPDRAWRMRAAHTSRLAGQTRPRTQCCTSFSS